MSLQQRFPRRRLLSRRSDSELGVLSKYMWEGSRITFNFFLQYFHNFHIWSTLVKNWFEKNTVWMYTTLISPLRGCSVCGAVPRSTKRLPTKPQQLSSNDVSHGCKVSVFYKAVHGRSCCGVVALDSASVCRSVNGSVPVAVNFSEKSKGQKHESFRVSGMAICAICSVPGSWHGMVIIN